ncbi:trans-aconitate 2-methyltransferase [Streptomyces sp. VRA16 Mangrove soil]|uniref:class I SAM-dependent methyltransferase n=1 Tax=Streptomyces sp. VRA16 Mangrove soil TaxID=2817434 RepID=UPI001E330AFE|nr:class I SAM-dependent methyltransferase [Streptomyces sp. VRA16 Mangrove soil]
MAQLLELDAEVLAPYLAELTGWLAELTSSGPALILDLGSGPGTGSFALARQFPSAHVTAVDLSPQMLHRLNKQAAVHGVADRISTVEANIDGPWDEIGENGPYDLIWAASFLHHVTDPARTLAQAFEQLRPGGLLAVSEMDFFPLCLPEDTGVGRPGLEARLHAVTNTQPDHEWTDQLKNAGFIVEKRAFEIRLDHAQAGPSVSAYAQAFLAKLRSHATDLLEADDLAALDVLLDEAQPNSVAHRDDLRVHTTRTTWIARRP